MDDANSIVVIGGGIAGLAAGVALAKAGWRVSLIEAKERLGGRIFTTGGEGATFELGAEFIHGEGEVLWQYISAAGLKTTRVSTSHRVLRERRLQPMNVWVEAGKVIGGMDGEARDRSLAQLLATQDLPAIAKQLTVALVEGYEGAPAAKISLRALRLARWDSDPGARQYRLANGYGELVDVLVRELRAHGADVQMESVARTVRWQTGQAEVVATREGKETRQVARAALVTVPLGVLKAGTIAFEPRLPEKDQIVAAMGFGNVRKILLRFRRAFWSPSDFGFIHAPSETIPTWWSDGRVPVLIGWAGGPKADQIASWTLEYFLEQTIDACSRIFGVDAMSLRQSLVEVYTHDWQKDAFTRGAYAYVPVSGLELGQRLAIPVENTLFFAGEATAEPTDIGTVHGAMASAVRAVDEVLTSHGQRLPSRAGVSALLGP